MNLYQNSIMKHTSNMKIIVDFFSKWYDLREIMLEINSKRNSYGQKFALNKDGTLLFDIPFTDLGKPNNLGFPIITSKGYKYITDKWMRHPSIIPNSCDVCLNQFYDYFGDDIEKDQIKDLSNLDEIEVILRYGKIKFKENDLDFLKLLSDKISYEDIEFLKNGGRYNIQ